MALIRVLLILSEAGSARFIEPILLHDKIEFYGIIENEAKPILENKFKVLDLPKSISEFEMMLFDYKFKKVIIGTSWKTSICQIFMEYCENLQVPYASLIDNWSNYSLRFRRQLSSNIELFRPKEIYLIDEFSYRKSIEEGLDPDRLFIIGHPYLERKGEERKGKNLSRSSHVIETIGFISESYTDAKKERSSIYKGFTEFSVLQEIIKTLHEQKGKTILIKLHPSEPLDKYKSYESSSIKVFEGLNSSEFIENCDIVIGMESVLLIESALLGKKAISFLPVLKNKDSFYGNMSGLTTPAYSYSELISILENTNEFNSNGISFRGSSERLVNQILKI